MPPGLLHSPLALGELAVFGVNHRTAPLHTRERLAISPGEVPALLRKAVQEDLLAEGVILSTCNRVELYACFASGGEGGERIEQTFKALKGIEDDDLRPVAYLRTGRAMIEHLFLVTCGLDSLLLGETQILGQVRDAFAAAAAATSTGPIFNRLFHQALRVGKRARAEFSLAAGITSVPSAAVHFIAQRLEGLRGRVGVLLGAGAMASLASAYLRGQGTCDLVVTNRTLRRAEELAATCGGRATGLDGMVDEVLRADFLLAACSAPGPLLQAESLLPRWQERGGRPLIAVDLSVPRVIDPGIAALDGVTLYDLDTLSDLLRAHCVRRAESAKQVEELISREVEEFCRWWQEREAIAPLLTALTGRCEEIRSQVVERSLKFLHPGDTEPLTRFSQSLVAKLIDLPLRQIKTWNPETPEGRLRFEVVRELFGLQAEGEGYRGQISREEG